MNGAKRAKDGAQSPPPFELNPSIDVAARRDEFRCEGRVRLADFLAGDGAARLQAALRARTDWRQVVNSGDRVFELDRDAQAQMSPAQRSTFDDVLFAAARSGFQHRYETIRVPDADEERRRADDLLTAFARFLSSDPVVQLLRDVTGFEGINFADAQATAYGPGDFLTAHDDEVAGKHRLAAYVFGLSPEWRADWGGLLLFHDAQGDIERGFTPRFNALNLFAVPQLHSVSLVSRAAPDRRYSVTGWLRSA